MEYRSRSADETRKTAEKLVSAFPKGSTVCLDGEMGAGKTVFVQGCMNALGYTGRVTSPTFALCNEYDVDGKKILHYDLCRITDEDDLYSTGFYDSDADLIFVEWAGTSCADFENAVKIKIFYGDNENERVICVDN